MKLAVPYIGETTELDARLVGLADFLGVPCSSVALSNTTEQVEFLKKSLPDECSCLAVNPQVLKKWSGANLSAELVAFLLSRFTHLLVYGLRIDDYDSKLVSALSGNRLTSVEAIKSEDSTYIVAEDSRNICEAFAGLSFGPVNTANDHVFCPGDSNTGVQKLISIGDRQLMTLVKSAGAEVIFLASEGMADLNTEIGDGLVNEYFSRFVAFAMALRYLAGDECWRPCEQHATVIIDDPLLRPNYGFLNFKSLLDLMRRHNFQTTIAFIPYNYKRSSAATVQIFRENPERLSICFHGNDHSGAEFASTDPAILHAMLHTAEQRIEEHRQRTRLNCDRVMVFPQGRFSDEAMVLLKEHNFDAAVNTVSRPMHTQIALTLGELAQPAVLRYGAFPLFLRKYSARIDSAEIAFNLFFGRPNFVVEHHEIFKDPSSLIAAVSKINAVAPGIQWSSVGKAVSRSILKRRSSDGTYKIRAYSRRVRVTNTTHRAERFLIEWHCPRQEKAFDCVLRNGVRTERFEADDSGVHGAVTLEMGVSETFSLVDRNPQAVPRSFGIRHRARVFLRRGLSEVRDNVVSKNAPLLAFARMVQSQFRH